MPNCVIAAPARFWIKPTIVWPVRQRLSLCSATRVTIPIVLNTIAKVMMAVMTMQEFANDA
jgi:hypothetical protein